MHKKAPTFSRLSLVPLIATVGLSIGCRSRFIDTTIDNQSSQSLHVLEVDYPSASFGASALAAHAQFHYRFKVQGSGAVKLEYTDSQGQTHSADGPELSEGQEGSLMITVDDGGKVRWRPDFVDHH